LLQFPPRCLSASVASVNSVVSRSPFFFSASETNNLQPTTVDFCPALSTPARPRTVAATLKAGAGEKLALRQRGSSRPKRVVGNALSCNDCRGNGTTQVAIPEEPCGRGGRRMVIYGFPIGMARSRRGSPMQPDAE
jgi:hypothetical protein